MYYSNKCQLFCTHEYSAGGKRGDKLCKLLLKPVNNDGYDAVGDEIEIYVRIMNSDTLLIWTEGNSQLTKKWIITDEAIVAPDMKSCAVCTFGIPLPYGGKLWW